MRAWGSSIVSLAFVALGVLALRGARDMSDLGSVFPRAIASAMILFALVDLVGRFVEREPDEPPRGSNRRRAMLAAIMLGWAFGLSTVGFLVTSVAASLLLLAVANHEPWTARRAAGYVVTTLVIVVGLYSIFAFGLEVPLPEGLVLRSPS